MFFCGRSEIFCHLSPLAKRDCPQVDHVGTDPRVACARLRFAAAFGTICAGGTDGACKDKKTCRYAQTTTCKVRDETADEGRSTRRSSASVCVGRGTVSWHSGREVAR